LKIKSRYNILLIDNEYWTTDLFTKWLGEKADVHKATDAMGAFKTLRNKKFDYVFIDFDLNGQDGFQAYNILKPYLKKAEVYILSGYDKDYMMGFKRDIDLSGIKGYIHKNDFERFANEL